MKRKNFGIAIMGFLFCAGSMAMAGETNSVAPAEAVKNLVENGGFEVDNDGSLAKWEIFGPIERDLLVSKENCHGGSRALRVPISTATVGKITGAQQWLDVRLFKPGDVIDISGYVFLKSTLADEEKCKIAFEVFAPDGKAIAYTPFNIKNLAGEWQLVKMDLTIPKDFNESCKIKLISSIWHESTPVKDNVIYFDDIQVTTRPVSKK